MWFFSAPLNTGFPQSSALRLPLFSKDNFTDLSYPLSYLQMPPVWKVLKSPAPCCLPSLDSHTLPNGNLHWRFHRHLKLNMKKSELSIFLSPSHPPCLYFFVLYLVKVPHPHSYSNWKPASHPQFLPLMHPPPQIGHLRSQSHSLPIPAGSPPPVVGRYHVSKIQIVLPFLNFRFPQFTPN